MPGANGSSPKRFERILPGGDFFGSTAIALSDLATGANHPRGASETIISIVRNARDPGMRRILDGRVRSTEIRIVFAILGIFLGQPGMEIFVMLRAGIAAVRVSIITEVQEPTPAIRTICSGSMRGKTPKQSDVARLQFEVNPLPLINAFRRQRMIVAIGGG